jgi:hypothetical protein
VARGPHRYSEVAKREFEKNFQELVDSNIIQYSDSPRSSGVVPAAKKDGTTRLCVDSRGINACTKVHPFRLPTLTSLLNTLAAAKHPVQLSGFSK